MSGSHYEISEEYQGLVSLDNSSVDLRTSMDIVTIAVYSVDCPDILTSQSAIPDSLELRKLAELRIPREAAAREHP